MQSRMEKYFDSDNNTNDNMVVKSRTKKNQELYKEVSNLELEDFDLNNNMSVIGDNSSSINLDDIKDILDKKYHETPKNKSFGDGETSETKLSLNETREYDINSILAKAKENKEVNYEEDRLKKIRNTQYDILKSLDIMNNEEEIEEKQPLKVNEVAKNNGSREESERKLKELIDTITAKELIKEEDIESSDDGDLDPLDLFSDLKGEDENTRVMGMLAQELKEAEEENQRALEDSKLREIEDEEYEDEIEEEQLEENEEGEDTLKTLEEIKEEELRKTQAIKDFDREIEEEMKRREEEHKNKHHHKDNSENSTSTNTITSTNTFTNTMSFTQSDFDDFIDLKEDMQITKIIVKILVVIIIIAFVVGIVILANQFLQLGLF